MIKPCIKCGATERAPNGRCRPCWREIKAKYYAANPAKARAASCEYQSKFRAEYTDVARDKARVRQAKWRLVHPEDVCISSQNRRARKVEAGGQLSKDIAARLYKLQRGKCACGCKQPLGDNYHRDHIMPLALGGTNTDDNLQLLRAKCNLQKSAKHPIEFMQKRGFLL